MKRTLPFVLISLLVSVFASCGDTGTTAPAENTKQTEENTQTVSETAEQLPQDLYHDDLGTLDFDGEEFRIWTLNNLNMTSYVDVEEETGNAFDDSLYRRNRRVENRSNTKIVQTVIEDNYAPVRQGIMAGDDAFDVVNLRCPDALTYYSENLIYGISEIPNIDLSKPYWAQKVNESITIGGNQFAAIGAFDINALDLTFALAFNKKMLNEFDFESPYQLVSDGKWTFDKMLSMMTEVISDINGDGVMDASDRWGYFSSTKMVLPGFWIGAGEMSIRKDEKDNPYINMESDHFISVFNRIFEITWDSGAWFTKSTDNYDVPDDTLLLFMQDGSLFMDVSLFYLSQMRSMDSDFGVLPYPKLDEAQSEYYSRVAYFLAFSVPSTNTHLEMTGALLELLNCESANLVVPAYYDISLKGKYSRDEESAAMLDLILENRVVDLGDTILCPVIRDGFIRTMFKSNKRDLVSTLAKREKSIQKEFDKMPTAE